jgi:phenylalanyl-tRNA synthetase alpha chain
MSATPTAPAIPLLPADVLRRMLAVPDLTDRIGGAHAIQLLVSEIEAALAQRWSVPVCRHRASAVAPARDNYDRLRYDASAVTRDARYTRYIRADLVLRSHTTAMIPPLLDQLAARPARDVVLSCAGIVYRRDVIDRHHVGEPHQHDLWRIRTSGRPLGEADLDEQIGTVLAAAAPGRRYRTTPAVHPYTLAGRQIDIADGDQWVEVGECGLVHPEVLASAGLPPTASGLAMGLGLDRLLMVRKGIDDIRLLRSRDPRVAAQMRDLDPYVPVSAMPPVRRDLSLAIDDDVHAEELGDRVREALGQDARSVESVEVLAVTPAADLPDAARARLGIRDRQRNVLLRVVLRDLERTLTTEEANRLRDRIYLALHRGDNHQWAGISASAESDRQAPRGDEMAGHAGCVEPQRHPECDDRGHVRFRLELA